MKGYGRLLLPVVAGVVLSVASRIWLPPGLIVYLRADPGTLFVLLGLVISAAWGASLWVWTRTRQHHEQVVERLRFEQADAHRRFLRRLDHELKNPLTAIRAGMANLTVDPCSDPVLSSVRTQVDRLAHLSGDLRKRADLETQPVEREPVNMSQLLTDLVELAQERPEAAACQLRLTLPHVPWPLPPVAGDRDLIFLALHNLVDNALKFSRTGDTIEVRAFEDDSMVAVEVADTGPGVRSDELPHLGEELYRGTGARGVEGSGLGLALVYAIVTRHQGTVAIRSRLGKGTVMTVRLPVLHY